MRNNKEKIITIAALVIAVIGLSIGFAAFASTLNISTSAHVNPTNTFSVKFASSVTGTNGTFTDFDVTPDVAVTSTASGDATAGTPTIDNDTDPHNPTIGDLSASFTAPGQSVTYTFYVVNDGNYDAYLTNVVFNNASNHNSFRKCLSNASSDNPATQSIVDSICNNITFTMSIGSSSDITSSTTLTNHLLEKTHYEEITVVIAYTGSAYADGAFTVDFGDIDLHYRTIDEVEGTATSEQLENTTYLYEYVYDEPDTYATSDNCVSNYLVLKSGSTQEDAEDFCNMSLEEMSMELAHTAEEPTFSAVMNGLVGYGILENRNNGNIIGVSITGLDGVIPSVLTIPSTINNYPVIKIASFAFREKYIVSSVTIPSTVREIGDFAFYSNPLQTVVIGDSVNGSDIAYIGTGALNQGTDENINVYPNLTSVTIYADSGDVSVGDSAFGTYDISSSWHPVGQ